MPGIARSHERQMRTMLLLFAATLASVTFGINSGPAVTAAPTVVPCVSPSGTNINEFYGISVAVTAPYCTEIGVGQQFTITSLWSLSPTFKHVPKDFEPWGDTPTEDFIAKFSGATYVFDAGTTQEASYFLANGPGLATGILANGLAYVNPITLGTFHPLSPGPHSVEVYFAFEAMHCDGLSKKIAESCLGPGSVFFDTWSFDVLN